MASTTTDTRYTFVECDGQKRQKHRKEAQSHVMREYMRKRRLKEVEEFQNSVTLSPQYVQISPGHSPPRPLPNLKPLLQHMSNEIKPEPSNTATISNPEPPKDPPKAKWGRPALSSRSKRLLEGQDKTQQKPQHIAPKPLLHTLEQSSVLSGPENARKKASPPCAHSESRITSFSNRISELFGLSSRGPERPAPLPSRLRASLSAMGLYSPQDSLTSYRKDAFGSFPVEMTDREFALVDYWMSHSSDIYAVNGLTPNKDAYKMKDLVFPAAMSSAVAFETLVLLPAALHRASQDTMLAEVHVRRSRVVRRLNELIDRLVNELKLSGDEWLAMMGLIAMERLHGDADSGRLFGQVLWEIGVWKYERQMQWLLEDRFLTCYAWVNALWAFDPEPIAEQKREDEVLLAEAAYDWTVKIMNDARAVTIDESEAITRGEPSTRRAMFQPDSGLYQILSPTGLSKDRLGVREFHKRSILRAKCLLLIHLSLLSFRSTAPDRYEEYLTSIQNAYHSFNVAQSPDPLLLLFWILLTQPTISHMYTHGNIARITSPASASGWPPMTQISNVLLAWLALGRDDDGSFIIPTMQPFEISADLGFLPTDSYPRTP